MLSWDYDCKAVDADPPTPLDRQVGLVRADGFPGFLEIRGTDLELFQAGRRYRITIEEVP